MRFSRTTARPRADACCAMIADSGPAWGTAG